jgi:hypothetical protein
MIRITIYDRPQETSILVEGRMVGLWVKALEKCWEIALAADSSRAVRVTLAASVVDREGRELLTRMRRCGVTLDPSGILTRGMIKDIEAKV